VCCIVAQTLSRWAALAICTCVWPDGVVDVKGKRECVIKVGTFEKELKCRSRACD